MQKTYSPEMQDLFTRVEQALLLAGENARRLAEQTGTRLITRENAHHNKTSCAAQDAANTPESDSAHA